MCSNKTSRKNLVITILFFIYLAVVFRITVFRSDFSLNHLFQNGSLNLTLFRGYTELIEQKYWFSFIYLFAGNIVWFVPFGMYLQYKKKIRTIWYALLYGFLFSLLIETLQYVFETGFSELDDLVLNTFGVWLGAVLGLWVEKHSSIS